MARRGNPNMRKGAPSVNPHGRAAPIVKAARPPGTTAVAAYSGYVVNGDRGLGGSNRWIVYANAYNVPVIATGLRYFANLLAGTDWHVEENPLGGDDAARGAEIVRQGLLESPMLRPWSQVVRKAAMYRALGFSIHATAMRKRPDGMIVYSAIEHRPQHSIDKWLRKDETRPFHAVVQRSAETASEYTIPLDQCFYMVDDTLTDSPEGVGMLRHVIEYVRRLDLFEQWEGKAFSEDLAGVPYSRAPLAELAAQAGTEDAGQIRTRLDAATDTVRTFMNERNKSPDTPQWLMLDSSQYTNPDGTIAGVPKWEFDLVKTETHNLDRIDQTIRRVELQIARVLGIEFALMGADGAGSYAQHVDKTSMFASNLQTTLTELGWAATHQLARRLVARNGLDPDTACPRLVAEPISTEAIETVTRSLANLAAAALRPDDPAIDVLRKRMRLPPAPDGAADLMLPRAPLPDYDEPATDTDAESAPAEPDAPDDTPEMEAEIDE